MTAEELLKLKIEENRKLADRIGTLNTEIEKLAAERERLSREALETTGRLRRSDSYRGLNMAIEIKQRTGV